MTRVFLAAGVAALAIAAPASAGPHGGGGHGGGHAAANHGGGGGGGHGGGGARASGGGGGHGGGGHGGGGGHAAAFASHGGGHGGGGHAAFAFHGGGGQHAQAMRGGGQRHAQAAPRMQRQQRMAAIQRGPHGQHGQMHAQRQQHGNQMRMAQQQQMHGNRQQMRMAQRQQMHGNGQTQNRMAMRQQQMRFDHQQQMRTQMAEQQQMRGKRFARNDANARFAANNAVGYGAGGCPPGLADKGCTPPGIARQQVQAWRSADPEVFRASRIQMLAPRMQIVGPYQASQYIGRPLSFVDNYVPLAALPASLGYLYPSTPNYYYQYGGGYLYQVDRRSSLIDALIPLLAGGYLPGTYLPSSYMNSYVPDSYGLSSFYPSSYNYGYDGGYGYDAGYGYNNVCNRYAYGNVYQVDCATGMVENVIPTYAGGYGVGQMLPAAYNYYNVPMQYRSMYYPTADYSYWYAPGAIYQYDPSSSLITSVAALMSPGFSVGQALPAGYGMYNVPMAYRSTYYDTPNAWYRYNNGYIYQVDPATQLVTAIVASLLT